MSVLNAQQCLSVPGRLVLGPTGPFVSPTAPTTPVDRPDAGTDTAGSATTGTHLVAYSYTYGTGGETALSPPDTAFVLPLSGHQGRLILAPSTFPAWTLPASATGVRVYVTTVGGSVYYFVGTATGTWRTSPVSWTTDDATLATLPAYAGPTAAAGGVYPYGGTPIGYVAGVTVVKETEYAYALSESLAIDRAKTYRGATKGALVFTLLQYDPTGYNQVWASSQTSANGYSGANILSFPQPGRSVQPGLIAPSSSLLFVPDNPQHPGALFYSPSWCEETRQKLAMVLNKPLESLLVIIAGLDTSSRDVQIARLADMTL